MFYFLNFEESVINFENFCHGFSVPFFQMTFCPSRGYDAQKNSVTYLHLLHEDKNFHVLNHPALELEGTKLWKSSYLLQLLLLNRNS